MNVNAIKGAASRVALVASMELSAKLPAWIEGMSPASRKAYLKAHPDSKYASQLGGSGGSGDKVADKHNATIRQSATDAKDSRAQIKLLKSQLPESTETRADKAKATRINKKIAEQMENLKSHKAAGDKAKALLEKRSAAKTSKPTSDAYDGETKDALEAVDRRSERLESLMDGATPAKKAAYRKELRELTTRRANLESDKPAATKESVGTKPIRKAGRVLPKGLGADSSPGGNGKSSKNSDMGLKNPPAPKGSPLARQIQKGKDDKNAILDKGHGRPVGTAKKVPVGHQIDTAIQRINKKLNLLEDNLNADGSAAEKAQIRKQIRSLKAEKTALQSP